MRSPIIFSLFLSIFIPYISFAAGIQSSSTTESDWNAGFCQKISLKNTGNTQAFWSEIHFSLKDATISSSWNGNFSIKNNTYTITPLSWNNSIAGGQTIDIGYCANGSGRPKDVNITESTPSSTNINTRPIGVHINEGGLTLDASVTSDWNTGYCRNIILKNTLTVPQKNWKFSFDSLASLNLWSGKITKNNATFIISPEAWNGEIGANNQVELGFCANGETTDSNWKILSGSTVIVPPTQAIVDGVCGTDNGKTLSNSPTNLCTSGIATPLSGNELWMWSCQGQNNGKNTNCQASKTIVTPPVTSSGDTVNYTIDINKDESPISPYIYGRNFGNGNSENFTATRLGGNRLTGYNWENNASNAGSDWNHSSDAYLSSSEEPGKAVIDFHDTNRSLGVSYSLITMPMAGYVARDKNGSVGANEGAPSNRWDDVIFTKKTPFSLVPDLKDGHVYSDEFVNFLVNKYGKANSPTGIKGYSLDNEPGLWATTHPRLHTSKVTVLEMITKSANLAKAIKGVDNSAEIFGAVTYGFGENKNLQDASDWANYSSTYNTYIDAFLANLKSSSTTYGTRLLDVLDIHWYPEAQGTNTSGGKTRITENNTDSDVVRARMQAPRSLWDPTYKEDSWIGQWFADSAFPVIPKLKSSIDKYYPGTKLSISEFDYGGTSHISGGIATADVLGIYGKYGVYFASYWGDVKDYVSSAYKLYRNVDGMNTSFGDTSVSAINSDIENTSIYASKEGKTGKIHIVLINKKGTSFKARININSTSFNHAEIYGFDSSSPLIKKMPSLDNIGNTFDYTIGGLTAVHMILSGNTPSIVPTSTSIINTNNITTVSTNNKVNQSSENTVIVNKYIGLIDTKLQGKTTPRKINILENLLSSLKGAMNSQKNMNKKDLLGSLVGAISLKVDQLKNP